MQYANRSTFRPARALMAALLLLTSAHAQDGGQLQWARTMGGPAADYAYDVLGLPDGGAVVVGEFQGQATFGVVTLESMGESDAFVVRLTPQGTVLWAKRGGGPYADRALHVRFASDGNLLVDGTAFGPMTFGLGTNEPSFLEEAAFDAKYNPITGTCVSVVEDTSRLMDVPRRKGEFVKGQGFIEAGGFDLGIPLSASNSLIGTGGAGVGSSSDAFLVEYERVSGALVPEWSLACGGPEADRASAIAILPAEASCVVVGTYRNQALFRTTVGSAVSKTAQGESDIFIARYRLEDDDNDGLSNLQEVAIQTSSSLVDTDGDLFWDVDEVLEGTSPTMGTNTPSSLDASMAAIGLSSTLDLNGGIPDADEFALLMALLAPNPAGCGIHAGVRAAFSTNVQRVHTDSLAKPMPSASRLLAAAYMTLGDSASIAVAQSVFADFGLTLVPANYDISQSGFLARYGDADADGTINQVERTNASSRADYLSRALGLSDGVVLLSQNGENGTSGWCWSSSTWDLVTDPDGLHGRSWHCGENGIRLNSPTVDSSGYSRIEISYRYRDHGVDSNDLVYLEINAKISGNEIWNLEQQIDAPSPSENLWQTATTVVLTSSSFFHNAFKIRFSGSSIDSGEDLWIDDVVVRAFP